MPTAKEKRLRKERILAFIRENRELRPSDSAMVLQTPSPKKDTLRQKKRVSFTHSKHHRGSGEVRDNDKIIGQGLTSCLITKPSETRLTSGNSKPVDSSVEKQPCTESKLHFKSSCTKSTDSRLIAGANNPAERNVGKLPRTDSECHFKEPGIFFLQTVHSDYATQEVKLNSKPLRMELKNKCDYFPKFVDNRPFKDEATQTLYRESSAQTLAFLPEIYSEEKSENLELFTLANLLPGTKPPGLHEVEFLERARKRWDFSKALKANFKRLLNEAREVSIKTQYKEILEAFEWEQWIQREEDIQECQMMRLEIVIKMFDKREKQMHANSKIRIEKSFEDIEKKRQAGLRKNEIEYQREMRRINIKLAKTSRKWEKQSPMHALGSPCSEFYGPLIRHGVDPARRCFEPTTGRRAFDMRIDDLEKRVNMRNVQCPFSKLKEWSKPKEYDREYERNFCNDDNLQRLYESLKTLRTQADMAKEPPRCLKTRLHLERGSSSSESNESFLHYRYSRKSRYTEVPSSTHAAPAPKLVPPIEEKPVRGSVIGRESLETLICSYEGNYIGTIMQFLADEMQRLKEQRKLHFFCILAQKERWRREAAEAGLRQKENTMRMLYEEMFQLCNTIHNESASKYSDSIFTTDISHMAEDEAVEAVTELAKQIDADIERWLESFKLIQNPLNFTPLRLMLQDMISPDMGAALRRYENSMIAQYIVEDVIFGKIWDELETFDIASTLTSDFIDRLIDNDLYLFSSDSESDSPHKSSWYESHAIIRKLIRQAVPGRRWKEENERLVTETFNSLFDDIFEEIIYGIENPPVVLPNDLLKLCQSRSYARFINDIPQRLTSEPISTSHSGDLKNADLLRMQFLNLVKKFKEDNITKDLQTDEKFKLISNDSEIFGEVLQKSNVINPISPEPELFSIISTVNIVEHKDDLSALRGSSVSHKSSLEIVSSAESSSEKRSVVLELEPEVVENVEVVNEEILIVEVGSPEISNEEVDDEEVEQDIIDNSPINSDEHQEEDSNNGEEVVVYVPHDSKLFKLR